MKTKLKFFLVLFAAMMLMPQGMKAAIVTTTYDFSSSAYGTNGNDGNNTTEYSEDIISIGSTDCIFF